uniref:uncharacterized protein LOC120338990 isoform X1 n=1 Tax=Styela clava TaxID=7725 RepID=UPI00193AD0BD|nr:uncharacterized protein LOC120338990 isoform X1 [Styela clava]
MDCRDIRNYHTYINMKKYAYIWCLIKTCVVLNIMNHSLLVGDALPAKFQPATLTDDMGPWEICGEKETCLQRRKHNCKITNGTLPHIACGTKVWMEELEGCDLCAGESWIGQSEWSKCLGTGCEDTVQRSVRTCAFKAVNRNCRSILTRYCNPTDICYGTWSSWTSTSPECKDQCSVDRSRVLQRTCMKDGEKSISCASKNAGSTTIKQETLIDDCSASPPCQTTEPSTTTPATTHITTIATTTHITTKATMLTTLTTSTSIVSTTTTRPKTILSSWSSWTSCTADCKMKTGTKKRTRKCSYENGNKAPDDSCGRLQMVHVVDCIYENADKCNEDRGLSGKAVIAKTTSKSPITVRTINDSENGSNQKFLGINSFGNTTGMEVMTTANPAKENGGKWQWQVLVIVLATTACLIIFAIFIYIFCGKRNKAKEKKKRTIGEISIVGLQSHTGFMDGMESYGFAKSMMPKDDLLAALNPNAESSELVGNVGTYQSTTTPARELPNVPLTETEALVNQNSHNKNHIYEEMKYTGKDNTNDLAVVKCTSPVKPIRRALSYHESSCKNSLIIPENEIPQMRRQSCFSGQKSSIPRRAPPKKPPRKSSIFLGEVVENNNNSEMKEVPKSLYEASKNMLSPDLQFINLIHPPNFSPTTDDGNYNSLKIPNSLQQQQKMMSRSAPVSPNHSYLGTHAQQTPYMQYMPMVMPYNPMPMMASCQNQNGGIIYMPVSPMYTQVTTPHMMPSPHPQSTPLHGADTVFKNIKAQQAPKPRPRTMYLPRISISTTETCKHKLSPQTTIRSPILEDYAEMRRLSSSMLTDDDNARPLLKTQLVHELHGTHRRTPSNNSVESDASSSSNILQDDEGYLAPTLIQNC